MAIAFKEERKALCVLKAIYLENLRWVNAKIRQIDQVREDDNNNKGSY